MFVYMEQSLVPVWIGFLAAKMSILSIIRALLCVQVIVMEVFQALKRT